MIGDLIGEVGGEVLVLVDRGLCGEIGGVVMGEREVRREKVGMVFEVVVGIHGLRLLGDRVWFCGILVQ